MLGSEQHVYFSIDATQATLIVQEPCDQYTTGQRNLWQEWYAVCINSSSSSWPGGSGTPATERPLSMPA